jgi:hypothetical protein
MSVRPTGPGEIAARRAGFGAVAGSAAEEERVILRDGSSVVVRPLAAGDEATIEEWFAGLGPETRHARFLGAVTRLDDRSRSTLAAVDHRDHEAITATIGRRLRVVVVSAVRRATG